MTRTHRHEAAELHAARYKEVVDAWRAGQIARAARL